MKVRGIERGSSSYDSLRGRFFSSAWAQALRQACQEYRIVRIPSDDRAAQEQVKAASDHPTGFSAILLVQPILQRHEVAQLACAFVRKQHIFLERLAHGDGDLCQPCPGVAKRVRIDTAAHDLAELLEIEAHDYGARSRFFDPLPSAIQNLHESYGLKYKVRS